MIDFQCYSHINYLTTNFPCQINGYIDREIDGRLHWKLKKMVTIFEELSGYIFLLFRISFEEALEKLRLDHLKILISSNNIFVCYLWQISKMKKFFLKKSILLIFYKKTKLSFNNIWIVIRNIRNGITNGKPTILRTINKICKQ